MSSAPLVRPRGRVFFPQLTDEGAEGSRVAGGYAQSWILVVNSWGLRIKSGMPGSLGDTSNLPSPGLGVPRLREIESLVWMSLSRGRR